MPNNFLPPEIDPVVMDIVASFRVIVQGINATAESVSNPDRFLYTRTVEQRNLVRWNKQLQDFDRVIETSIGSRSA